MALKPLGGVWEYCRTAPMGSLPAVRQEGEVLFQDMTELPDQLVSLVREHVHDMIDHLEILPLPP